MGRIEASRAALGVTALAFVARATIAALREHPALNAWLDGETYTRRNEVNLGIAVSLGEYQYRISRERQGPLLVQRAKIVRGIVLKTEQVAVDRWIDELSEVLAQPASNSAQSRAALERFTNTRARTAQYNAR